MNQNNLEHQNLKISELITEKIHSLTKTEKKIAEYVTQNPDKIIYQSINELGEVTNSSDASIIRLCKKLGFKGYQELKISTAKDTIRPLSKILEGVNSEDGPDDVIRKCFQETIETLNMTMTNLNNFEFVAAATVITNAHRIYVFGLGSSAPVAHDIAHKFLRIGLEAYSYSDSHFQMIAACTLTKNDVVIGISHSGSSIDIVQALEFAKKKGATTICITNQSNSPITQTNVSDIKLFTSSHETKYRVVGLSSRLAQLAIADALYVYIGLKRGESTIKNFEMVDEALAVKKF